MIRLFVWSIATALIGPSLAMAQSQSQSLEALMRRCAPSVHPVTLRGIIRQESSGYQYVLVDDGPANLPWSQRKSMVRSIYPRSQEEAERIVLDLLRQGHLVDIGLMQVQAKNALNRGIPVRALFDPCTNISVGAQILTENYLSALSVYREPQRALHAALSMYNTGTYTKGITNGYVQSVIGNSRLMVPELKSGPVIKGRSGPSAGIVRQAPRLQVREQQRIAARMAKMEVDSF